MAPKKNTGLETVYEDDYAQLAQIQITYPVNGNVYRFNQHNPNNKNASCLYYAFARGYYGPPHIKIRNEKRKPEIRKRMNDLWDHVKAAGPTTQARADRRTIYQTLHHRSGNVDHKGALVEQLDWQISTLNWGTIDAIQVLADAYDVEILVWTPTGKWDAKHKSKPNPLEWQLQARGDRHPPSRQIHLVSYPNIGHWCLLVPSTPSKTPDVINDQDPHMTNEAISPDDLRAAVPFSGEIPRSLLRYPDGHPVYNAPACTNVVKGVATDVALVPKDMHHIADIDTEIPDAPQLPVMPLESNDDDETEKGDEDKAGKEDAKDKTQKELIAAAEAELAAAIKARIAAVERENAAVENLAKLKGPVVIDVSSDDDAEGGSVINVDSDDDADMKDITAAAAAKAAQDKKDAEDAQLKRDAQALAAAAKKLKNGKKTDKKGAKTSSKGPLSAASPKRGAKGSKKPPASKK